MKTPTNSHGVWGNNIIAPTEKIRPMTSSEIHTLLNEAETTRYNIIRTQGQIVNNRMKMVDHLRQKMINLRNNYAT